MSRIFRFFLSIGFLSLNISAMKPEPKMAKWPFIVGDLLLLGLATWIVIGSPGPLSGWAVVGAVTAVAVGAWLAVTPFLSEYNAALRFAEADRLTDTAAEIRKVEGVAEAIAMASSQWQAVQDHSSQTVTAAREISERMSEEAKSFRQFLQQSNDAERNHLRLEVDKLRRVESEWVQAQVRLLDHVYALFQAGARSGQPNLREQLGNFQNACREIVRRLGLISLEPEPDELFDPARHQVPEGQAAPSPGATVDQVLATGYSFQGQLLRRSLVSVKKTESLPPAEEEALEAEEPDESDLLGWRPAGGPHDEADRPGAS